MPPVPTAEQDVMPERVPLVYADPTSFGSQVGEGMQNLSRGLGQMGDQLAEQALRTQQLKNEATAQDADVQFQGELGQLEADYYGKTGKDAAAAYPAFQQSLLALRAKYVGMAPNPMVANMIGQSVGYSIGRSMRSGGIHAGDEERNWMAGSADSRAKMLAYNAAKNFNDPAFFDQSVAGIKGAAANLQEVKGWSDDQRDLYANQLIDRAKKARDDNLIAAYKQLPLWDQIVGLTGGKVNTTGETGGADYHALTVAIEQPNGVNTPGNPHTGPVQASPDWWKQFGAGGDPNNMADAMAALDRETEYNTPKLQAALGRKVTNADLYLAHQQGLQGAIDLLSHPDAPASSVVPEANIAANLPGGADPKTVTSAQFAGIWAAPFNRASTTPPPVDSGTAQGANSPAALASLMDDTTRRTLTASALKEWDAQANAQYTQQEHDYTQHQRALTQAADTAVSNYKTQMIEAHENPGNPAFPSPNLLTMTEDPAIKNAPGGGRIEGLINFMASLNRPEGATPNSAANTVQLYQGIQNGTVNSPDQIDGAFTDKDPAKAISKADRDYLQKALEDRKTPWGQTLSEARKQTLAAASQQINPKGLLGIDLDNSGAGRVLQWTQAVDRLVQEYQKAGKDPSILFDATPSNKEYVGRPGFVQQFVNPLQRNLMDQTGAAVAPAQSQSVFSQAWDAIFGGAPAAAAAPAAVPEDVGARYKGMDAQAGLDALKADTALTPAQKRAIAVDNGWAK